MTIPRPPRAGPFGAGVLAVRDGHVLLTRRSATEHDPLTWACFGGMGESGEGFAECAVRELAEESGILVNLDALVPVHGFVEGNGFTFVTYVAHVDSDAALLPSAESHEVGAFPLGGDADTLWSSLPAPLHPGMAHLVTDPSTSARVLAALAPRDAHSL